MKIRNFVEDVMLDSQVSKKFLIYFSLKVFFANFQLIQIDGFDNTIEAINLAALVIRLEFRVPGQWL